MNHRDPESYRFDEYQAGLGDDWLASDPLLEQWLARSRPSARAMDLVREFGRAAATRYRESADRVERRPNLPYLAEQDPYNRRTTEVVIPDETRRTLGEIHGSGIWKAETDERVRYALVYLLNQNGEFGVTCSTACTDGLARVLRGLGEDARSRAVVEQLENATQEVWIHGAQFVTEIQGGSDAATNTLRAVPADDGLYALHGRKWFCSNPTADYWLVTARIDGSQPGHRGVSLFCVPRLLESEGEANGHVFQRLKDKLGTRALPTAELDFTGALGWPIGALDAGLRNMVATVLTTSRIHCTLSAAASVRRAAREACAYANFRRAFGRALSDHPLIAASLERLRAQADRMEAGAFATVDTWVAATTKPEDETLRLWARVLVSLAKAVTTRAAPGRVYEAMMVFGGNGIEERFCPLPRIWRDSAIIESWEGPYTLLLMQALEDLVRYDVAGREEMFLRFGLGDHFAAEDAAALGEILAAPAEHENVLRWEALAQRLYGAFEEKALTGFGVAGTPS